MTEETIVQSQPEQGINTHTFQITFKGKKEDVTIRKAGYKERNEFLEKTVEAKIVTVGNTQKVDVILHPFRMRSEALQRFVIKAPFDLKTLLDDPDVADVGDKIYEEIEKFNKLSQEKKVS